MSLDLDAATTKVAELLWREANPEVPVSQGDAWDYCKAQAHDVMKVLAPLTTELEQAHSLIYDLRAALAAVERDRDRLAEQVAQYAPIALPILADMKARKERSARMAAHTHYCWTCSDGTKPGDGCHNCRNTGMDQTPCVGCPGPQPAAEPSGEAGRLPHAACHIQPLHFAHPWGDPAHWCDGSGEAGA